MCVYIHIYIYIHKLGKCTCVNLSRFRLSRFRKTPVMSLSKAASICPRLSGASTSIICRLISSYASCCATNMHVTPLIYVM